MGTANLDERRRRRRQREKSLIWKADSGLRVAEVNPSPAAAASSPPAGGGYRTRGASVKCDRGCAAFHAVGTRCELGAAAALMQQRSAAELTFTTRPAETKGENTHRPGARGRHRATVWTRVGELQPFLQHWREFFPFLSPFPWLRGDCGSFNERSCLMPTNPDLANNLFPPACKIKAPPRLQRCGRRSV